jgi:3-hydroxyisobutyrate dehydrogenase
MDQRVGIIGFGATGSAFAGRLCAAGCRPVVFDTDHRAMEAARAAGLDVAASAAEIAEQSDVIDLIVRTDEDVLEAASGPGGIAERAHPGSTVIVHSTVSPSTTLAVAGTLTGRGVCVIDACLAGTPEVVRAGGAIFLAGGEKDLVDSLRPHLLRIGKEVLHLGPLGAGNAAKLVKNLVTASERLIIHEALLIGESAGLPYVRMLEMLHRTLPERTPVIERWESVFDPSGASATPDAGTNLFDKDLPLAAELGRSQGLDLPITFALERSGRALVGARGRAANGTGDRQ